MILVPKPFADAAIERFPDRVEKLTETKTRKFYDDKVAINQPDEIIDEKVLAQIKAKQDLGLSLIAGQQKSLDPQDDTPGIRKNYKKKWVDYKSKLNVSIIQ